MRKDSYKGKKSYSEKQSYLDNEKKQYPGKTKTRVFIQL